MNPNLFVVVRPETNSPAPAQRSVYAGARKPNAYLIKFLSVILGLLTLTAHVADGFNPLYNGKDLSGWHVKDSKYQNWVANGEILSWKTIPSWYVVSTQDNAINPDLQRFMAKRMNAQTKEIKASHVGFISNPS